MPSKTHRVVVKDNSGNPMQVLGVTLAVSRDRDGVFVLGSIGSPVAATEVSLGVWEVASGNIYDNGEDYAEHWTVTSLSNAATEFTLRFSIQGLAPVARWQYADWPKLTPEAARLDQIRMHMAEVAQAIDADVGADGITANHGTLGRYLEWLGRQEERMERRVVGSPSAPRYRGASFGR